MPQPSLWRSVYDQAHFVLTRYAAAAGSVERQAADRILEKLAALARVQPASDDGGRTGGILIAASPADRDLADLIAAKLPAHGHRALSAQEAIDTAEACVVILSKATARPTPRLSREWSAILEKKWNDAGFPLFVVTRHARAVRPAFLSGLDTSEIRAAAGKPSIAATVARRVGAALSTERA